jgi:hypothetical protein
VPTLIVPFMKVWIEQWYLSVTLPENAIRYVSPGISVPELNESVSAVTVWPTFPLFVQQIVAPGATLTVAGEKLKSTIETVVSPA